MKVENPQAYNENLDFETKVSKSPARLRLHFPKLPQMTRDSPQINPNLTHDVLRNLLIRLNGPGYPMGWIR